MKTEIVIRLTPGELAQAIRNYVELQAAWKGVRWTDARVEIVRHGNGDAFPENSISARLHISTGGSGNEAPK